MPARALLLLRLPVELRLQIYHYLAHPEPIAIPTRISLEPRANQILRLRFLSQRASCPDDDAFEIFAQHTDILCVSRQCHTEASGIFLSARREFKGAPVATVLACHHPTLLAPVRDLTIYANLMALSPLSFARAQEELLTLVRTIERRCTRLENLLVHVVTRGAVFNYAEVNRSEETVAKLGRFLEKRLRVLSAEEQSARRAGLES